MPKKNDDTMTQEEYWAENHDEQAALDYNVANGLTTEDDLAAPVVAGGKSTVGEKADSGKTE